MCIEMIEQLDKELNVAVILVPADGNCMCWSLRSLFLEIFVNQDYNKKAHIKSCNNVRNIIKNMWIEKAEDDEWQRIFQFCYQDHMHIQAEKAPKKGKAGHAKVQRAQRAAALPVARREPVDPTLMAPSGFMEPPAPDLEGLLVSELLKPRKKRSMVSTEEIGEIEPEEYVTRRRPHTRWKKSGVDVEKMKLKKISEFLAAKELCNGDFMRMHRRAAALKNAGVCPHGTFKKFRELLVSGSRPTCDVCLSWMTTSSTTMEQIQEILSQPADFEPPELKDVALAGDPVDGAPDNLVQQLDARQSKAEVRQACVDYLNSIDHIDALDTSAGLFYRCKICPRGKQNKLGKCTLNTVRRFVGDHLSSQTHIRALAALGNPAGAREQDADVVAEDADPEDVPCEGYCVSNPASTGALNVVI